MDEEEIIKQKMLQERMQGHMQSQQEQEKNADEALKKILPKILDEKARERLNNIKIVKPELAMQLSMYLVQLFQTGQVRSKITDEQLKNILAKLSEKRDFTINRK
jgi:programmed cell death protein 5